jgi:3-phosphoglycerate kinase
MHSIRFIDSFDITGKIVLLRTDFDVSLDVHHHIANDARIRQNLPTIQYLLKHNNSIVCLAKLGRPKGYDPKLSLSIVANRLQELIPNYRVVFISDDIYALSRKRFFDRKTVYVLENIRFYKEEKEQTRNFIKHIASFADVFVNDAFSMCHRNESSVTGLPAVLPSYGGLSLQKEINAITAIIKDSKKPFVSIIGGAKIDTKIGLVEKLMTISDTVLIAGGLANTIFKFRGFSTGGSLIDINSLKHADTLLQLLRSKDTNAELPIDVVLGSMNSKGKSIFAVKDILPKEQKAILDIGPETIKLWSKIIAYARTIIWNGPVGYVENPLFAVGTNAIFEKIAENKKAKSLIGGGDTIKSIADKNHISSITHVSTAGGAMLEFIEKGTLPGLEALKS